MSLSFEVAKWSCSYWLTRFFLALFFCSTPFLFAVEQEEKEVIVIPSTEVINRDVFLSGGTIEVSGTINGDLYVFGKQVFIDGTVNGDVLVVGASVTISGVVANAVRVVGGQVEVSGLVGRTVSIIAASVDLTSSAVIGLSAVIFAGNASIGCEIGRDVRLHASTARFSGKVKGNVNASVRELRISSLARINGEFEYWSDHKALIDPQATIKGKVIHHPSFFYQLFRKQWIKGLKIGSKLAGLVMNFFYSLVIALMMTRYFRGKLEQAAEVLSDRPVQALIGGGVVLILLPLSCLILLITILGVPFALGLLSVTVVSFYTAKLLPLFWVAKKLSLKWKWKEHFSWLFVAILIVYFALTLLPYVGKTLSILALLFGLGAIVLGKQGHKKVVENR